MLLYRLVEVLALEDVEVGQRDDCRYRVIAERIAVRKQRLAIVEKFEHDGHWRLSRPAVNSPTSAWWRGFYHAGLVAEVVTGEHRPSPAERTDNLVEDK